MTAVAIVTSDFYPDLTAEMLADAQNTLINAKYTYTVFPVAGVFELPAVVQRILQTGQYAGAVCLGVVIQGETPHFDFVSGAAAHGITQASLTTGLPIAFGVLTANTYAQAEARVFGQKSRKGVEATEALIRSMDVLAQLS
jgi:6,7-dimethyl-8-ribityllumazine synthase